MPHVPERTRSKLLAAAVDEFGRHGYAGARVERISATAGVNRERLYAYFGSKRRLFETVLNARLAAALDDAEVRGSGVQAVADFAAAYFDICVAAQELPRLVTWEGLELDLPADLDARRRQAQRKVDDLVDAVPGMTREQGEALLLTVVTLCHGWVTGPNVARIIAGDETAHRRRREHVVGLARLLAEQHARA